MISYSRVRSLSASVRRAWSGSRLSRSLRTGRTTETPSGSGITLCRIPPRPMPSPGHRGCGLPTEKMRPPWHTAHRDLLVALEQMTVDERVGPAEVQIGAGVHDDVADDDGQPGEPHHERQQHRGRSRAQPWTERCDEAGHQDDEGMETLREVLEVGARERVLYVHDADEAGRQDKLASRRIVARRAHHAYRCEQIERRDRHEQRPDADLVQALEGRQVGADDPGPRHWLGEVRGAGPRHDADGGGHGLDEAAGETGRGG